MWLSEDHSSERSVRSRRRRRGLLALVTLVMVGLVTSLLGATSQAGAPAGEPLVAVVQPGDTLWSVAARHVPSRDPYGMIAEIRRLNGLPDNTIHPGQELILP